MKNRDRFIELGLTIATLRKMKGLSQEQLAEKASMSRSNLSTIEAPNIVKSFSIEVLYNIADALEVNAGESAAVKSIAILREAQQLAEELYISNRRKSSC